MKYFAYAAFVSLLVFTVIRSSSAGQTSAPAQATPALDALKLPPGTAFLARLSTNLDGRQCKPGDPVEAEVKQDIKQGHDVLLKKGSVLLGHVAGVKAPASDTHQLSVAIAFDSVRTKDGKRFSLNVDIQALAPEADVTNNDTLAAGRGMGVTSSSNATVSGHATTMKGTISQLSVTSTGVYDLQGLELGDQTTNGAHYSTLTSSTGGFHLKKGAQLVMKMVSD
jgi:hypothetical protein